MNRRAFFGAVAAMMAAPAVPAAAPRWMSARDWYTVSTAEASRRLVTGEIGLVERFTFYSTPLNI